MNIKGYDIEFLEDEHIYLVDGVIVPSITQMLKSKFGNKYIYVSKRTLENASKRGTEVHKEIEEYEKYKINGNTKELRNYKFLKKAYEFETIDNEVPVILFKNDEPIACGDRKSVV